MKINSNLGVYFTPLVSKDQPDAAVTQAAKKAKDEDKEELLIQKEIISVLKEHGLPNDVDYFLKQANNLLYQTPALGQNASMQQLVGIISLANKVRFNNELYKEAVRQLDASGAESDLALTVTGELYAINNKGLHTISLNTYKENPEQYQLLTNNQLLELRSQQPSIAYNSKVLKDLNAAVGMKSIVEYVKSTITSFGNTEFKNTNSRYTTGQKDNLAKGFAQLLGDSAPLIFKETITTRTNDQMYSISDTPENQKKQIDMATTYLWNTLEPNMKNLLRANAASRGLDPNDPTVVKSILTEAVIAHTDHTIERSIDTEAEKEFSKAGAGGSGKTVEQTREEMIASGDVVPHKDLLIRPHGTNSGFLTKAQPYGRPSDPEGHTLGSVTIRDVINKDRAFNVIDTASISFGDRMLTEKELNRVVYDGISQLNRAILPYDANWLASKGQYKVDFNLLQAWDKFSRWMLTENPASQNVIAAKIQELGIKDKVYFDPRTQSWKFVNEHAFYLLNGYASALEIKGIDDSIWFDHIPSSEGANMIDRYLNIVNSGTDWATKNKRDNISTWLLYNDSNNFYKSMIFMPMLDSAIATVHTNNERELLNKYMNINKEGSIKSNF